MPSFASLPGFRDFYPDEFAIRAHIVRAWRETARRYGFEEYDGPPLEPLELYIEKSGQEIVNQLYNFEDKGGRAVSLRPEMTPTLARMVGARAGGLRKPVRWFSIPQLFRYERTQRGRLREHFQWNVDIIGESDVGADAEVVAVAIDSLRALGLTAADIAVRVNDRRLLEKLIIAAGVPSDQLFATYAAIDKLGREDDAVIRRRLVETAGLGPQTVDNVFAIFQHRTFDAMQGAYGGTAEIAEDFDRLAQYFSCLGDMGLGEFVLFDPTIVRGLAYYTGIVFEIFDRKGELRAVCGGGRYDRLIATVSDADLPALGFGMGDVVLGELLRERGLLPSTAPQVDYFIVAVSDAERPVARRIAHELRDAGSSVVYALKGAGVGKQFKDADARGARRAIVIGPDEVAAGIAVIREMQTGEEQRVKLEEIANGGR